MSDMLTSEADLLRTQIESARAKVRIVWDETETNKALIYERLSREKQEADKRAMQDIEVVCRDRSSTCAKLHAAIRRWQEQLHALGRK